MRSTKNSSRRDRWNVVSRPLLLEPLQIKQRRIHRSACRSSHLAGGFTGLRGDQSGKRRQGPGGFARVQLHDLSQSLFCPSHASPQNNQRFDILSRSAASQQPCHYRLLYRSCPIAAIPRHDMAMATQTLHGACACGRNRYVVEIPQDEVHQAELRYDKTTASRYHSAAPLTLWLRVPLMWFTSATFAQHPDETRTSIRRSFDSPFSTHTHQRQFCGYCGTQLSSWNEQTRDEAEHICLTVGSLLDEDQELLGELGYLPSNESSDDEVTVSAGTHATSRAAARLEPEDRGAPWFEEMVQNTPLGRVKQQRGGHSGNGIHVEWEIMEWTEGDDADDADDEGQGTSSSGKRKIGDVEAGEDAEMRNL